jgi:hypothetical protein
MFIVRGLERLLSRKTSSEAQLPERLALEFSLFYFSYLTRYNALLLRNLHSCQTERNQAYAEFHEETQDDVASLFVKLDNAPGQSSGHWSAIKLDSSCTVLRDGRVMLLDMMDDNQRTTAMVYLTMLPTFDATAFIKKAPPKSAAR